MYATVEKVQEGFNAVKDKHDIFEASIAEMQECINQMGKQLRRFYGGMTNAVSGGLSRKTFWNSEEEARIFGSLVFAAAGKAKCIRDDRGVINKALSEGSNVGGGYAVPQEILPRMIDMLGRYGKFRANCSVIPMGSDQSMIPSLTSDPVIYCTGENTVINEGDMTFGQVKLLAKTWAALLCVSNELTEDSLLAIGEIVAISMTRGMAKKEDEVAFVGDGTEAYFGMTGILGRFYKMIADSVVPAGIAIGSGATWADLVWADFEAMFALLPEDYEETAKLYCSKKFFYTVIRKCALAAGNNATGMFDLLGTNKTRHVAGYPVEFVRCMPSVTGVAQIPCILGDLQSGAYLGERRQLLVDSSGNALFTRNQTCFRGIERIDINIIGCGDAANPGPIVGLRTASS